MASRMPLTEISAQHPPRLKKGPRRYGRKGSNTSSWALFAEAIMESDENQIEKSFTGLSIQSPESTSLQGKSDVLKKSTDEIGTTSDGTREVARIPRCATSVDDGATGDKNTTVKSSEAEAATARQPRRSTRPQSVCCGKKVHMSKTRGGSGLFVENFNLDGLEPLTSLLDGVKGVLHFEEFANLFSETFRVQKVAEGGFAEVFKLVAYDTSVPDTVLKIIPIHTGSRRGGSLGMTVADVCREVRVVKRMEEAHGFTQLRRTHIVQGRYPTVFLESFLAFREMGGDCQNAHPNHRFKPTQLFAILDMSDAGLDLENVLRPSTLKVFDIFWSVAIQLAFAENHFQFEHRDMHVGNVCIRPWKKGGSLEDDRSVLANADEIPNMRLGLCNIRASIIDYTLSRANLEAPGTIAYDSIREKFAGFQLDDELKGEDRIQHETYIKMRDCVIAAELRQNSAAQSTGLHNATDLFTRRDKWALFVPQTNVCWLGYLLQVLLERSASRYTTNDAPVMQRLQIQMHEELMAVLDRCKQKVDTMPSSCEDLISWAVEDGYLKKEEIEAFKKRLEDSDS